jgi:ribonuclease VapC
VNKAILDASAILAILNKEPGAEALTLNVLSGALSSTVNLAEVQTLLVNKGGDPDEAWEDALSTVREAVPFCEDQARMAGGLVTHTRALGLSLGDRACLALGIVLGAPVYTTDRAWKKLKLGIPIHLLR